METAKQANAIIRDGFALLTNEKDIERFKPVKDIFTTASGMLQGENKDYKEAMLKGWMVSQATNMAFLLWRRGIMTEEIENAFRALPSTEEAVSDYDKFEEETKAEVEKLEEARKEFATKQHDIDIFKAILNGMSKEQAEAQYEKYKAQVAKSMGA